MKAALLLTLPLALAALSLRAGPDESTPKTVPPKTGESGSKGGKKGKLPAGIVARVNGREISLGDYSRYLVARYGRSKLGEVINRVLVEEEVARVGVEITPEDVEKEVERRLETTLQGVFGGDRVKMEADLQRRGLSLEERRVGLRQGVAYDLLRDSCILATRQITPQMILGRFHEVYGEDGVRYELRHLLLTARRPSRELDRAGKALPTPEAARHKAARIHQQLVAGADFVEMVRAHSEDPLTRANDGRIPVYRKNYFGEEFHAAVLGLVDQKRLSGVVASSRGFHLIELVRKEVTRLEDRKAEVEEFLKTRQPDAAERQNFVRRLREKATIQR